MLWHCDIREQSKYCGKIYKKIFAFNKNIGLNGNESKTKYLVMACHKLNKNYLIVVHL